MQSAQAAQRFCMPDWLFIWFVSARPCKNSVLLPRSSQQNIQRIGRRARGLFPAGPSRDLTLQAATGPLQSMLGAKGERALVPA